MRTLLLLAMCLAVAALAQPASAQGTGTVQLTTASSRTEFLTPAQTQITGSIVLDEPSQAFLLFGSPSNSFQVELTSPGGQTLSSTIPRNDLIALVQSVSGVGGTGTEHQFEIRTGQPGIWTYRIFETVPLASDRAVVVYVNQSSPVRCGIIGGGEQYTAGTVFGLSALSVENIVVLPNTTVTGQIIRLDVASTPAAITFSDDGLGADALAGDGLVTSTFSGLAAGQYFVQAQISGTRQDGRAFGRTVSATFQVNPVVATLAGTFTDSGVDLNADGLFDLVRIRPRLDVAVAGDYSVAVTLRSASGAEISEVATETLAVGQRNPSIDFRAEDLRRILNEDGPWTVARVGVEFISLTGVFLADERFNLGQTAAYRLNQLQRDPFLLAGPAVFTGVDTNANGRFDRLDVDIPVDSAFAGIYSFSARLVAPNGTELDLDSSTGRSFVAGVNTIQLSFDGNAIGAAGLDGPYEVRNLVIFNSTRSGSFDSAGLSGALRARQFEGFVQRCGIWSNGGIATDLDGQASHLGGSLPFGQQVADDFSIPTGQFARIDGFSAPMLTTSTSGLRKARLQIFEDCNGAPATTPFISVDNSTVVSETPSGTAVIVEYDFDLTDRSIWLEGGKTYWVSIVGLTDNVTSDLSSWISTDEPVKGVRFAKRSGSTPGYPYPTLTGPWTRADDCCIGCRDMSFTIRGEFCKQLWFTGSADVRQSSKDGLLSLDNGAASPPRAADDFLVPPCIEADVCFIDVWVWTNCSPLGGFLELFENDCGKPTGLPRRAESPIVIPLGHSVTRGNAVLIGYLLRFTATGWTLRQGTNYWLSAGVSNGGNIGGTALFAFAHRCDSACSSLQRPSIRPVGATEWSSASRELAMRIVIKDAELPGVNSNPGQTDSTCQADTDRDGTLSAADLFEYLNLWFAGCP